MSLLERAGSTVVEYFEWDLPKVSSQGISELLKDADNRRFSSEPDVVESNSDADSKGVLVRTWCGCEHKDIRPLMTSFLVLHHEKS